MHPLKAWIGPFIVKRRRRVEFCHQTPPVNSHPLLVNSWIKHTFIFKFFFKHSLNLITGLTHYLCFAKDKPFKNVFSYSWKSWQIRLSNEIKTILIFYCYMYYCKKLEMINKRCLIVLFSLFQPLRKSALISDETFGPFN